MYFAENVHYSVYPVTSLGDKARACGVRVAELQPGGGTSQMSDLRLKKNHYTKTPVISGRVHWLNNLTFFLSMDINVCNISTKVCHMTALYVYTSFFLYIDLVYFFCHLLVLSVVFMFSSSMLKDSCLKYNNEKAF